MEDRLRESLSDVDREALDLTVRFMEIVGWHPERIELHEQQQLERIGRTQRYDVDDRPIPRNAQRAA